MMLVDPKDRYRICKVTRINRSGDEDVHYIVQHLWYFLWCFPSWETLTYDEDDDAVEWTTISSAKEEINRHIKNDMEDIVYTKIECDVS